VEIYADDIVDWLTQAIDDVMEVIRIPDSLRLFMHGEED
jgi:hypothetical protein